MGEAIFQEIMVYVTRTQNTVAQYIATRPLLDLCGQCVSSMGARVSWGWWDQEGLDLEGTKERAVKESDGEEEQCREGAAQEETSGQD